MVPLTVEFRDKEAVLPPGDMLVVIDPVPELMVRFLPAEIVTPPAAVRRPVPMVMAPLLVVFNDKVPFTSQVDGAPAVMPIAPPPDMAVSLKVMAAKTG